MNANRSSGRRPIRLSTRSAVAARSSGSATTFSSVRFAGSIVVSFNCAGGISPRPLKRLTSTFAPALNSRFVFRLAIRVVHRVDRLGALRQPVQRRLRQIDMPVPHQFRQFAVEERHQQRGDVRAVHVGVGHDDDAAVAQLRRGRSGRRRRSPAPRSGPSAPGSAAACRPTRWRRSGSCRAAAAPPGSRGCAPAWPNRRRNRPRPGRSRSRPRSPACSRSACRAAAAAAWRLAGGVLALLAADAVPPPAR